MIGTRHRRSKAPGLARQPARRLAAPPLGSAQEAFHMDMVGTEVGTAAVPPPEAIEVAVAVCRQVAAGEIALGGEPVSIRPEYDPAALERELRDFDLALSRLARLCLKRAVDVLV